MIEWTGLKKNLGKGAMSKGVTPVVATMLLLLIAVAAVSSASVFLDSTISGVQDEVEGEVDRRGDVEATSVRIDETLNEGGDIKVGIVNSGQQNLTVRNEQGTKVLNLYVNNLPESWNNPGTDQIGPGEKIYLDTDANFPSNGEEIYLAVHAPYQSSDEYVCTGSGGDFC